ncbi:Manganese transporter SMF1 [Tolypocladium capitatum]|uniref:Manganese transporter SMF1 n=1 Tax=Tolypocladium capitatum TaxID=45235 RepID=A0A2K3QKZ3_9HYPO|nr:Manganese transporter SMF1 [Tolypocladium capitatum]
MRRHNAAMGPSGSETEVQDQESVQHTAEGLQAAAAGDGSLSGEKTRALVSASSLGQGGAVKAKTVLDKTKHCFVTFSKFIGPGFMISVAYIDPGNYATDIAAGARYQFKLLFIILLSNLFAILLQSLAVQLGTVTGLDLASMNRVYLPRWLNWFLYGLAEIAIIATDLAEVVGTAIALNLLIPKLPLVAGCALSVLDVMVILFFYRPDGAMKGLRLFEMFVCLLVIGVAVCFCIQLSMMKESSVGEVFRGYLPSSALVESQGLYQACGILGATVMPHSLFLGSGIVQPRLREYDTKHGLLPEDPVSTAASTTNGYDKMTYIPSHAAIKHSLKYSITELALSLFTFALFVNSAILIVAGASLYQNPDALEADIFGIHDLLSQSISPAVGTIFALALLLSGVSAGIVCTIAGQMVSEGALRWKMKPWLRRLITRSISITPSIIIAGAVGRSGLNSALTGSQVALSSVLPFVTLPLIYFTSRCRFMTVQPGMARYTDEDGRPIAGSTTGAVNMSNPWWITALAVLVWLVIAVMNVANLVLLGLGNSSSSSSSSFPPRHCVRPTGPAAPAGCASVSARPGRAGRRDRDRDTYLPGAEGASESVGFEVKKPYSAVTVTIENLTSESYGEDDLSGIPDLVDVIKLQASGPTEAARAIRKKLKYGNVHRQIRALVLLDGLIQNAGTHFQRAFADEPLLERLRVCGTSDLSDPAVRKKCTELYREWSQYASTPGLERIARLYNELPKRKVVVTQERSKVIRETENPFGDDEEEEAERASQRPGAGPSSQPWTPQIAPAVDRHTFLKTNNTSLFDRDKKKDKSKSRSKGGKRKPFDLEAEKEKMKSIIAESSIASTNLMNALQSINRERERISENTVAVHHFEACKQLRRRILRYIHNVESEQWLGSLLHANDELVHALMSFEQLDQSLDADSDSDDELAEQAHLYRMATLKGKEDHTPDVSGLSLGPVPRGAAPPVPKPSGLPAPARPPRPGKKPAAPVDDDDDDDDDDDPFGDNNVVETPIERVEPRW